MQERDVEAHQIKKERSESARKRKTEMKLSTKGRYGLRVMLELARHYGEGPVSVDVIAEKEDISGKYIHVLVMGLKSAGLIRALRGPKGGYELAKDPGDITALDVVTALEGRNTLVDCVNDKEFCSRSDNCVTRELWCDIAAAVEDTLAGFSLRDLAKKE